MKVEHLLVLPPKTPKGETISARYLRRISVSAVGVALLLGCTGQPREASPPDPPAHGSLNTPLSSAPDPSQPSTQVPSSSPPTSTETLPSSPVTNSTSEIVLYPPETETGIAIIDRVLDLVRAQDSNGLVKLARFTEMHCSTKLDIPCEGKPEGTPVMVFPRLSCARLLTSSHNLVEQFFATSFSEPLFLVMVYEEVPDPSAVPVKYIVVLASHSNDRNTRALYLDEGGAIVALRVGCIIPRDAVPTHDVKVILPPRTSK